MGNHGSAHIFVVSKNRGTLKWMVFLMENPIKMDDLGVLFFFLKHPYTRRIQVRYVLGIIPIKSYSFRMGLEPEKSYLIGTGLDS